MKYTRTATGLLSAQYRSVLKKCFMINMGLFALGAVAATPAQASIDDYKGVTYTGRGTDTRASSFYYQWTQDADTGVYKLHRLADATGADIIATNQDHKIFNFDALDDRIPGYPDTLDTIDGAVFGGASDVYDAYHVNSANIFISKPSEYHEAVEYIKNTYYIGYSTNNVDFQTEFYPIGGGISNVNTLTSIDAVFIGNYIKSNNATTVGHYNYFYGSAYGGAIYNSYINVYRALAAPTPSGVGVINEISGKFIANGIIMTNPNAVAPYSFIFDDSSAYQIRYMNGAYGGAIANQYGNIGKIENAVFENNYVVSTANNGNNGDVGGAAIYNSVYTMRNSTQGAWVFAFSEIGNINNSVFNENVAYTKYGDVMGGTILNWVVFGESSIGNINSNFSKNRAVSLDGDIYGGVIANMLGNPNGYATIASIGGKFNENTGSATNIYGGVIYNNDEITNGIKNAIFTDNTFTASGEGFGAAIYSRQNLTIAADNGNTLFKGNKINDVDNAVYMDNADLTVTAINGGTVTFYDTIDGSLGYKTRLTGDANSHINLYNDIKNAYVTADSANISTADGNIKEYGIYNLVADNTAKWTIDFSVEGEEADSFATTTQTGTAGKVVQIDHFNLTDKAFNEITNKNFKVQILKTQGSADAANLQLALTTQAASELGGEFVVTQEKNTVKDTVTENTDWSRNFREKGTVDTVYGTLGLATTDTLNDSIGLTTRNESGDYDESLGDTLMLVNTADLTKRNFNADQATYKVSDGVDNIGVTHIGELNINGQGKDVSTLDGNGAKLFDLSEAGTVVSLNDVKITNAKTVAKLTADDAVLNLNNVEISGNQEGIENNGTINLSGVNKITNDIAGNGTTNVNADWQMESKISGNTVNVNNAKLTAGQNNLANDVKLHATYGGNLIVGNNLVSLKTVQFDAGSQLTLNVDDLNTFGGIRANAFDIAQGAKIDITFGQDVLKGQTEVSIPLLALTDGSDINNNNFEDVFHNNMYKVKRFSDKSGIYTVEQGKTAREVSEENGGTQTNQDAAGAWVDGPSQSNPVAQGLANDLARFAQTGGQRFNEELTAIAPSESAVMNFMSETNNRIFSAVDYHLRAKNDDTESQLLYGVNIWAMPYYGKSKQKDIGKVSGYDSKSHGIIAGMDKQITQHIKLGIGGRYEETDISSKRRDYDVTTSTVFGYGEYKPSEWFVNGVVKYDFADWDEKRYAVNRTIKANYSVDVLSADIIGGYEYRKNTWFITPQAGLRWHHINRHGYTDTALQTVSGHNTGILSGVAGLHIQNNSEIKGYKIHPSLYAGITYDFNSGKDGGVVTLTNGTNYRYEGATLKRLAVEVSPSIAYDVTDKLSVAIEYTGAFRKHYHNHTASMGINYQF